MKEEVKDAPATYEEADKKGVLSPTLEELKELMTELGYEDTVIFENPDYASACLGVSDDGRAVYSYDKMVEHLMVTDDLSMEDAIDFIDYNTIRALSYAGADGPIVVYDFGKYL